MWRQQAFTGYMYKGKGGSDLPLTQGRSSHVSQVNSSKTVSFVAVAALTTQRTASHPSVNTKSSKKVDVWALRVGFMWPCLLFLYTYALQVR